MKVGVLLFSGISERVVDDILEQLSRAGRLPPKVIVSGRDPNLLGALDACWKDELDIMIVLVPPTAGDVSDALDLILESEQIDQSYLLWVQGVARAGPARSEGNHLLIHDQAGAESTLRVLSPLLV